MRTTFLPQQYGRRCPAGDHYVDPPRMEWDETPRYAFCPFDGLPLEQLACGSCGAPLALLGSPFGGYRALTCCPYCGEITGAPRERQHIDNTVAEIEIPPPAVSAA